MNPASGANVHLGRTGITIYGDYYRGPGEYHFRDFNWNDMPDVRADDEERPMADGDFPPLSYLTARNLEMPGFLVAESHEDMVHAIDRLKAQRGRTVRVTVDDPFLTSWADAEIRRLRFEPNGLAPEAEFQIQFRMADPRKYSDSEKVFASGEGVFHRGNYFAMPALTVTGAMPSGYRINGPDGKYFSVTQALTTGVTHTIDFSTGWLYRNGVLQQGAVNRAETWVIPPGQTVPMALAPVSGSGTLAILVPRTSI